MDAAEIRTLLERVLTPKARARLDRIEREHPELKQAIEEQLLRLARHALPRPELM